MGGKSNNSTLSISIMMLNQYENGFAPALAKLDFGKRFLRESIIVVAVGDQTLDELGSSKQCPGI